MYFIMYVNMHIAQLMTHRMRQRCLQWSLKNATKPQTKLLLITVATGSV